MNKFLVKTESEYLDLFKDFGLLDAEEFLGIEFAFVDGSYQDEDGCDESQDIDRNVFRKKDDSQFPEEYPCVVLLANESSFDRFGKTQFKFLEFIYQKDFT